MAVSGQIIVHKKTGVRELYIPSVHIQVRVLTSGNGSLIVAAFRTDGYHRVQGGFVETMQHLRATHTFTNEVDVPEHVAEYARKSEADRQNAVLDIVDILEAMVAQMPGSGSFIAGAEHNYLLGEEDTETEQRIAKEIQDIIARAGGQQ